MKLVARASLSFIFLLSLFGTAFAQDYPSKVVQLVVPYPPGGVVDLTGRILADQLNRTTGGKFIVVNKPGAGGTIGAEFVARAPADGYTLCMCGAATNAFAPFIYKDLRYDPIKDFEPVTLFTEGPLVLTVNASSSLKNLDDFFAMLKESGSKVDYSSNGVGTFPHLSVELLKQATSSQATHIPYQGGGKAVTALIANEVRFTQNHLPIIAPHIKSGRLSPLATTGESRSAVFPDVPTLKESGYDVVATAWFGVFAPAGTPQPIINMLSNAIAKAAKSPELREKIALQGDELRVEGPAAFKAFQAAELKKWQAVITAAGIKQ